MRNGSSYEVARLQQLSAQCRLAMLPPHSEAVPLRIEQLQPHILPTLADALVGFGRLRCHADVAALLYIRARIWHSVASIELRDSDAKAFSCAEAAVAAATCKPMGRVLAYASVGALELHITQLRVFDAKADALYTPAG